MDHRMDQLTLGEIAAARAAADYLLRCQAKTNGDLLEPLTQISLDTLRADLGAAREEFTERDQIARENARAFTGQ